MSKIQEMLNQNPEKFCQQAIIALVDRSGGKLVISEKDLAKSAGFLVKIDAIGEKVHFALTPATAEESAFADQYFERSSRWKRSAKPVKEQVTASVTSRTTAKA